MQLLETRTGKTQLRSSTCNVWGIWRIVSANCILFRTKQIMRTENSLTEEYFLREAEVHFFSGMVKYYAQFLSLPFIKDTETCSEN